MMADMICKNVMDVMAAVQINLFSAGFSTRQGARPAIDRVNAALDCDLDRCAWCEHCLVKLTVCNMGFGPDGFQPELTIEIETAPLDVDQNDMFELAQIECAFNETEWLMGHMFKGVNIEFEHTKNYAGPVMVNINDMLVCYNLTITGELKW